MTPQAVTCAAYHCFVPKTPTEDERAARALADCLLNSGMRAKVAALASAPVAPFFDSAPHHELPQLTAALRERGSPLRPELVQRRQWFDLTVLLADRSCSVSGWSLTLGAGKGAVAFSLASVEDVAAAVVSYLEDRAAAEQIARRFTSRREPDG